MPQRFVFLMLLGIAMVLMAACQLESPAISQGTSAVDSIQQPESDGKGVKRGTVFAAGGEPAAAPLKLEHGKVSAAPVYDGTNAPEVQDGAILLQEESGWNGEGGISVAGTGHASAAPDLATLNLGVEAFAKSVKEARDQAASANQRVVAALVEAGIAEEDIATRYFNISPRYGRERESVIGYRVNNQLTVKSRDLANIGELIDAVAEAGGDLTRFRGVDFSIEDTKPLKEQARAAAVADLNFKAGQLAELMGVEVGPAMSITEVGGFFPRQEQVAFAVAYESGGASTEVRAGEVQVTVTVHAVFAIE